RAVAMNESWGEPHFAIARAYSAKAYVTNNPRDWHKCVHYAMTGLNLPPTKTVLFVNPLEREVDIHRYLNIALNRLNQVDAALGSVNTALKRVPGDPQLEINRKAYENHLARKQFEAALRVFIANDFCPKQMAETALACIDGRAQSFVVGGPGVSPPGLPPNGISQGAPVIAGAEYRRPPTYPKGISLHDFPVACPGPHPQAWVIPTATVLDDLPLVMTEAQ